MLLGINEFLITSFRGGLSRAFFFHFENSSDKIELYSNLFTYHSVQYIKSKQTTWYAHTLNLSSCFRFSSFDFLTLSCNVIFSSISLASWAGSAWVSALLSNLCFCNIFRLCVIIVLH